MCMGIPMRILQVRGLRALAERFDGGREEIDLSLTGALEPGTWVLAFLGAAQEAISQERAEQVGRALAGLARVLQGGDVGDAFADLEAREPQLPPHLAAALARGEKEA